MNGLCFTDWDLHIWGGFVQLWRITSEEKRIWNFEALHYSQVTILELSLNNANTSSSQATIFYFFFVFPIFLSFLSFSVFTTGFRWFCCTNDWKGFGRFWPVVARKSCISNCTRTLHRGFAGSRSNSFKSFSIHSYNRVDFQKPNLDINCCKVRWNFLPFPEKER